MKSKATVLLAWLTLVGVSTTASGQRLTANQVNARLDSIVPTAISETHVPGAVIAIVRDDPILPECHHHQQSRN